MTLDVKIEKSRATVSVQGRLDTTTAPLLERAINEEMGEATELCLDMKGLEYISSAGLRVLLGAQKKMQKIGSMKLCFVGEPIMEILEMTGFADILDIE